MQRNRLIPIIAIVAILAIVGAAAFLLQQPSSLENNNTNSPTPEITATPTASPEESPVPETDGEATSPTPSPEDANVGGDLTEDEEANIQVSSPEPLETLSLPFEISGTARVFENTVQYRVTDAADTVLIEGFTTANSPDIGEFGSFTVTINSWDVEPTEDAGFVEVYSDSPMDGSEINKVTIPVEFATEIDSFIAP